MIKLSTFISKIDKNKFSIYGKKFKLSDKYVEKFSNLIESDCFKKLNLIDKNEKVSEFLTDYLDMRLKKIGKFSAFFLPIFGFLFFTSIFALQSSYILIPFGSVFLTYFGFIIKKSYENSKILKVQTRVDKEIETLENYEELVYEKAKEPNSKVKIMDNYKNSYNYKYVNDDYYNHTNYNKKKNHDCHIIDFEEAKSRLEEENNKKR